jgi:hypothetical protein
MMSYILYLHLVSILSENVVSELQWEALSTAQKWNDRTQLSVSPQKIVIVPFTRNGDLRGRKGLSLSGHTLQRTTEVKYIGLILGKGLT